MTFVHNYRLAATRETVFLALAMILGWVVVRVVVRVVVVYSKKKNYFSFLNDNNYPNNYPVGNAAKPMCFHMFLASAAVTAG